MTQPIACDLADLLVGWMRDHYGAARHATKRLARDAGVSPRTAENWLGAMNAPRLTHLGRLMALYPALEERVHAHVARSRTLNDALSAEAVRATAVLRESLSHAPGAVADHPHPLGGC